MSYLESLFKQMTEIAGRSTDIDDPNQIDTMSGDLKEIVRLAKEAEKELKVVKKHMKDNPDDGLPV